MIGMRPAQNRPASHRYLLVSALLALLALALSPVTALGDSSGTQYEDALPTADGGKKNDPPAKSSTTNGGASAPSANSGSSDSGSSGSSSESPSSESGGAAATTAGGDGGTGQGSQDKGQSGGGNQGAQDKGQASSQQQPASQVTPATETSDDDGGSSPLVPILIAIAVLAAISVGAVVMRQRRQRGGTSVSPKPSS